MSKVTFKEIQDYHDSVLKRSVSLCKAFGDREVGLHYFTESLGIARDRDASVTPTLMGHYRLVKHFLEVPQKKLEKNFLLLQVATKIFTHGLFNLAENGPGAITAETIEPIIQHACRKAHVVLANARNDKTHWLRQTTLWTKIQ